MGRLEVAAAALTLMVEKKAGVVPEKSGGSAVGSGLNVVGCEVIAKLAEHGLTPVLIRSAASVDHVTPRVWGGERRYRCGGDGGFLRHRGGHWFDRGEGGFI